MINSNEKTLKSFVEYCEKNPELRFWQALRNWSGYSFIFGSQSPDFDDTETLEDTSYIE